MYRKNRCRPSNIDWSVESWKFQELKRTKAYLYFGKEHPLAGRKSIEEIPRNQVRLVQCYEDEYTLGRTLMGNTEESPVSDMKISVITNSDYVMNELLRKTDLGNVSGGYLSREKESQGYPGYSLYGEEQPILFGCVTRQGEAARRVGRTLSFLREAAVTRIDITKWNANISIREYFCIDNKMQ